MGELLGNALTDLNRLELNPTVTSKIFPAEAFGSIFQWNGKKIFNDKDFSKLEFSFYFRAVSED